MLAATCFWGWTVGISNAMTPATVEYSKKQPETDQATGLFGGVRPNGTFVFKYSEDKGIRFYRVAPGVKAVRNGIAYEFTKLPMNTPIRVYSDKGRISAVDILEVLP
jgi:hypothetical protein